MAAGGMWDAAELDALRREIAVACRVLAARALSDGYLGHISLRMDADRLLVRCRGSRERGLAWTDPEDVRLVTFDGEPGADGELDGWAPPNELPLHTELLRRRPDVAAVVHAHPAAVVAAELAGLGIRPIVGAYDIPAARLAGEMVAAMGERPVVLLRGHGLTSCGTSVPEAVLRAIAVDGLARLSLAVVSAGGRLHDLPAADLAELPDLGQGFVLDTAWRHELARLDGPARPAG